MQRECVCGVCAPKTLRIEVITILYTQNNCPHQSFCHMDSLALPRHRCSPFTGQNPLIKSKLVAKRPLTPSILLPPPWVDNVPPIFTLQSQLQGGNKGGKDSQCPEDGASFSLPLQSRLETTWSAHLQLNSIWQRTWSGRDSLLFLRSLPSVLSPLLCSRQVTLGTTRQQIMMKRKSVLLQCSSNTERVGLQFLLRYWRLSAPAARGGFLVCLGFFCQTSTEWRVWQQSDFPLLWEEKYHL